MLPSIRGMPCFAAEARSFSFKAALGRVMSVSYTHLDVYKRQGTQTQAEAGLIQHDVADHQQDQPQRHEHAEFQPADAEDVYKRQLQHQRGHYLHHVQLDRPVSGE